MKNKFWYEPKLLIVGFILLVLGSFSALILCIIALFNPLFSPGFFLFWSFIILLIGFALIFIDCQNNSKKQQKNYEDLESLIKKYNEKQKKDILHKILIIRLLSALEEIDEEV